MKKIITAMFVCALLVAAKSEAQTTQPMMRHHGNNNGHMKEMLKDSLGLSDVQIDSVMAIREQTTGTVMAIKNDTTLSQDQRRQQIKEARMQMKMRLSSVLSKEQIKELEEMQRNMHKGAMMKNENSQ